MILTGLKLDTVVEVARVGTRGWGRVSLRATAGNALTGAVEVRRAYSSAGPTVPYTSPLMIPLNGETVIDLGVDDCPGLAFLVTTAGQGEFELEAFFDRPMIDSFDLVEWGQDQTLWSKLMERDNGQKIAVVADLDKVATASTVELRAAVDPNGQASVVPGGGVALDGSLTTIEVTTRGRVDLYKHGSEAIGGQLLVYCSHLPGA